jgi:26 proteasome complex subunit DSS1
VPTYPHHHTNSDWNEAESEVKLASNSNTQQLWEEDWDHDDAEDDFSAQLKEELSKTR